MSQLRRFDPLEDLFRGFLVSPIGKEMAGQQVKIDVTETSEGYLVHAELPGVKKEDIHINIEGNEVTISAETKFDKEQKEGTRLIRSERYYGKMSRSFRLSEPLNQNEAKAKFNDGVLELVLPRQATARKSSVVID